MQSQTVKLQIFYGICTLAGIIATMHFNIQFIIEHQGFSVETFIAENYANNASASISNDFLVILAVFIIWSFFEAKRLAMPYWWLYILLTFGVALAFSLPLFLLMRERYLARSGWAEVIKFSVPPATNPKPAPVQRPPAQARHCPVQPELVRDTNRLNPNPDRTRQHRPVNGYQ